MPATLGTRRRPSLTLCLLLAAGSALAATRPLKAIVPDYMEGDLETAITPTPQKAELKDTAFPAGKVVVVKPARYDAPDTLVKELAALLGAESVVAASEPGKAPDAATVLIVGSSARSPLAADARKRPRLADLGADAYLLHTAAGAHQGKNLVLLAGNSPAADFWAFATLRQMIFVKGGVHYVREGTVLDFPRFRFRGNKRPRKWEWRYKANYGWFFAPPTEPTRQRPDANFRWDYFRHYGAWVRHGSPLMATDAEMDNLVQGYEVVDDRGKKRRVQGAAEYYKAGCREFVLKFDDTGSQLSPATVERFGKGGYFAALHHYLAGMHRRLKALDPASRVFFMPRPYYYNSFETQDYARALRAHGPLPDDVGLSVCGPEVLSYTIPTACLTDFRELFGLKAPSQIYDNHGRGGDLFPCQGRAPDLWREVSCLFPERGTPVTRITVCDYLWNPEAYDPKRSLRLAVRELASRRPDVYAALLDYVLTWNRDRWPSGYPPRRQIVEQHRRTTEALKAKYDALAPLLAKSPMAVELDLATELWGPPAPRSSYEWGEFSRLRRRIDFQPYMLRYGWQETQVSRAEAAPTVDGRLDEAAWRKAPRFDRFVRAAWGTKQPPENPEALRLAADQTTRLALLHTASHVYVGIEFDYPSKPELPNWARNLWQDLKPGQQGPYAWRVPCFEVFFDVRGRRADYYHLIANIAGIWRSKHFGVYEPGRAGAPWVPGLKFACVLGEKRGTFEMSIPFADLRVEPPKPGAVWGFQCFRSKMGPLGLYSGTFDLVGGDHAPSQFGRIVFQ